MIHSKSCQMRMNVVQAMPTAANANPASAATGSTSTAHHEETRPVTTMKTRNAEQ